MAGRRTRILKRRSSRISAAFFACILGVAIPLCVPVPISFLISLTILVACVVAFIITRIRTRETDLLWVFTWIICLSLGFMRTTMALTTYHRAPPHISFSGTATITSWRERIYANFSNATATAQLQSPPYTTIALTLPTFPPLLPGDGVRVDCELTKGTVSDVARGVWYQCKKPQHLTPDTSARKPWRRILHTPVRFFTQAITKSLPEPAASFTSGILLGVDDRIPPAIKNDFRTTGTGHIFALSGFNITIIATSLAALLGYIAVRSRTRFALTASMLGFFVLSTGAQSSSIRAGIMGIVILLARHVGRIARARILIPLAASLMLIANPLILRYDRGFQLSFLATAGILLLGQPLRERLKFLPDFLAIRDTAAATLAATIATAPLLIALGNTIGPTTIIANVLIGPLIPLAMATGFLSAVITIILPAATPILAIVAQLPAQTIIDTAGILAHW